ncbi:MAG TPA: thioredoxin domain-containing protein, partial [bacterium]|nr:thioredoxin domain-containing protein [bacterium]
MLPLLTNEELSQLPPDGGSEYNRLIFEKSPYLLQHARNPVKWWSWCDEAFETARAEDKPVFLSIGYATCHWCHVMEHESFEDAEIASAMNALFICVKVDREERPDIDHVYMAVTQAMTGHGGWPMTVLMTWDKKPFFTGTYFPKRSRHGRIGMHDLIKA